MTERQIQDAIFQIIQNRNNNSKEPLFFDVTTNVHFFEWESDILFKDKDDCIFEMEIKTSLQDYNNDFEKKRKKHRKLSDQKEGSIIPNYFFFVLPSLLVPIENIPEYAGLYEYSIIEGQLVIQNIKPAPKLSERRSTHRDTIKMLRSTYFKYWRLRTGQQTKK